MSVSKALRKSTRKTGEILVVLATLFTFGGLTAGPVSAAPYDTGTTVRVSPNTGGAENLAFTPGVSVSGHGRYVAFISIASNLVANDTNNSYDVFVRDRIAKTTKLVSRDELGAQTTFGFITGQQPLISADGQHIAYVFEATMEALTSQAYVRNLQSNAVIRMPHIDTYVQVLAISKNGRYLLVTASNRYEPTIHFSLWDATTNHVTTLLTSTTSKVVAAAISDNARYVAYDLSGASNQVYRLDRTTGVTSLVSRALGVARPNAASSRPSMSADGRYVAFQSNASNLVASDTNGVTDVFVRDMTAGTTTRVSVSSTAQQGNMASYPQTISSDGNYVAFTSAATNLVPGDTNSHTDVFVRERSISQTRRVSLNSRGGQANGASRPPAISADGLHIAFISAATNLVAGDTNGHYDAFVRDAKAPS